jgi:hypothetical protein
LRDVLINLLAEFIVERGLVEAGEFFVQFYAMDHVRHKFLVI